MCITANELNQKVAELRSLKTFKEELENEIKAVEADIIEFFKENQQSEYIGTDYKATYKAQSRTTIDRKRLESDLGDLSEYEKVATYYVLRVN